MMTCLWDFHTTWISRSARLKTSEPAPLMHEKRTGHVSLMTKDDWVAEQRNGRRIKMDDRNDDKGYVIRIVDQLSGRVLYRGNRQNYSSEKDALMPNDTYTISGAKRALANLERRYPDGSFYSIERLSCYYYGFRDGKREGDYRQGIYDSIEHAMNRLDELWDGNDFDNGDKMRINEVRNDLRYIKTLLLEQGE